MGVSSSSTLAALQRNGTRNSHSDWAREFNDRDSNVMLFDGEVSPTSEGKGAVFCTSLNSTLRYHTNNYHYKRECDPITGAAVKFAVGINDHGLWAYGLHNP